MIPAPGAEDALPGARVGGGLLWIRLFMTGERRWLGGRHLGILNEFVKQISLGSLSGPLKLWLTVDRFGQSISIRKTRIGTVLVLLQSYQCWGSAERRWGSSGWRKWGVCSPK